MSVRLLTYHVNQDDPKKCTARKLKRLGFADITHDIRDIPYNAVILNPVVKTVFSPEDKVYAEKGGIVAVDCSWGKVEEVFSRLKRFRNHRALPFVVPVNPVNYGKPFQLTTLEAFVTALYIIGEEKQAERISLIYKWSQHFIDLNKRFLEVYRSASTRDEIIEFMKS
ncbi:MAG TPA: DUF367 family protein, partial [Thermoplasmatales archaeon]|nr:DUF367 family protein [Thermoplasmatales archaeon]